MTSADDKRSWATRRQGPPRIAPSCKDHLCERIALISRPFGARQNAALDGALGRGGWASRWGGASLWGGAVGGPLRALLGGLGRLGGALVRRALSGAAALPLHEQPAHQHDEHRCDHLHEMLGDLVARGVSPKRPKDIKIGKML